MLKRYSEGVPPLEIIEERESLFRLLPSTTPERLQKKTSSYTISPQTRYVNLNSFTSSTDVSHLYDSDTRPKPVERKLKDEITGLINCTCITNSLLYFGLMEMTK